MRSSKLPGICSMTSMWSGRSRAPRSRPLQASRRGSHEHNRMSACPRMQACNRLSRLGRPHHGLRQHGADHQPDCQRRTGPGRLNPVRHLPDDAVAGKAGTHLRDSLLKGAVMKEEDSDEQANQALLNIVKRKARERLTRDGSASREAIHRRIRSIAKERDIPADVVARLLKGKIIKPRMVIFSTDYGLSLDWLLYRSLEGLRRMTKEKHQPPASNEAFKDILEAFGKLSKEGRTSIVLYLNTHC